jgi:coiled-coil domain-containing protein 55
MSHFHRELLQQSEQEHQATVAATSTTKGPTLPDSGLVNLRIQRPLKYAVMSDAMFATMAKVEGKDFELNEDNQIVDRRELQWAEPCWRQHSKLAGRSRVRSIAFWTADGLL